MFAKLSTKPQAHAWEASQRLDGYKLPAHTATIRNVSEVSPVPTGDGQGAPTHSLKAEPLPPKKLTECVLGLCSRSLMLFWQHIYSQSLLTLKTDSSARRKKLFSQPNIF